MGEYYHRRDHHPHWPHFDSRGPEYYFDDSRYNGPPPRYYEEDRYAYGRGDERDHYEDAL